MTTTTRLLGAALTAACWLSFISPAMPCKPFEKMPLPNNCNAYKECDGNSNPKIIPCPAGLHYDRIQKSCQDPEVAQCGEIERKRRSPVRPRLQEAVATAGNETGNSTTGNIRTHSKVENNTRSHLKVRNNSRTRFNPRNNTKTDVKSFDSKTNDTKENIKVNETKTLVLNKSEKINGSVMLSTNKSIKDQRNGKLVHSSRAKGNQRNHTKTDVKGFDGKTNDTKENIKVNETKSLVINKSEKINGSAMLSTNKSVEGKDQRGGKLIHPSRAKVNHRNYTKPEVKGFDNKTISTKGNEKVNERKISVINNSEKINGSVMLSSTKSAEGKDQRGGKLVHPSREKVNQRNYTKTEVKGFDSKTSSTKGNKKVNETKSSVINNSEKINGSVMLSSTKSVEGKDQRGGKLIHPSRAKANQRNYAKTEVKEFDSKTININGNDKVNQTKSLVINKPEKINGSVMSSTNISRGSISVRPRPVRNVKVESEKEEKKNFTEKENLSKNTTIKMKPLKTEAVKSNVPGSTNITLNDLVSLNESLIVFIPETNNSNYNENDTDFSKGTILSVSDIEYVSVNLNSTLKEDVSGYNTPFVEVINFTIGESLTDGFPSTSGSVNGSEGTLANITINKSINKLENESMTKTAVKNENVIIKKGATKENSTVLKEPLLKQNSSTSIGTSKHKDATTRKVTLKNKNGTIDKIETKNESTSKTAYEVESKQKKENETSTEGTPKSQNQTINRETLKYSNNTANKVSPKGSESIVLNKDIVKSENITNSETLANNTSIKIIGGKQSA